MKAANLVGETFGLLTVAEETHHKGHKAWLCNCQCGGFHIATTGNLRRGNVNNCGCARSENRKAASLKHGHNRGGKRTKEYRAWSHILGRCHNPTDNGYRLYGAKGIQVHPDWHEFPNFLRDMGKAPSKDHSIDRINNGLGYQPGNCRWATSAEQSRNTSRNIKMPDGTCLKDKCEKRSLSYPTILQRVARGATVEQALSPLKGHAYRVMIAAATGEAS